MKKLYELPKGRRIIADFDENEITKVTVQALDGLIGELNYYADKVCDLEQIRNEIEELDRYYDNDYFSTNNCPMYKCNEVLLIIDKYTKGGK